MEIFGKIQKSCLLDIKVSQSVIALMTLLVISEYKFFNSMYYKLITKWLL